MFVFNKSGEIVDDRTMLIFLVALTSRKYLATSIRMSASPVAVSSSWLWNFRRSVIGTTDPKLAGRALGNCKFNRVQGGQVNQLARPQSHSIDKATNCGVAKEYVRGRAMLDDGALSAGELISRMNISKRNLSN